MSLVVSVRVLSSDRLLFQIFQPPGDILLECMLSELFFNFVAARVVERTRGEQVVDRHGAALHALNFFLRTANTLSKAGNLPRQSGKRPLGLVLRFCCGKARRKQVLTRPVGLHGSAKALLGL